MSRASSIDEAAIIVVADSLYTAASRDEAVSIVEVTSQVKNTLQNMAALMLSHGFLILYNI